MEDYDSPLDEWTPESCSVIALGRACDVLNIHPAAFYHVSRIFKTKNRLGRRDVEVTSKGALDWEDGYASEDSDASNETNFSSRQLSWQIMEGGRAADLSLLPEGRTRLFNGWRAISQYVKDQSTKYKEIAEEHHKCEYDKDCCVTGFEDAVEIFEA
ncbi:hypothetical protein M422DRAFT_254499 [Sphaerobolus stellatus SS14]|uniref:Uncharacterized protein n=1 Tax=Sphaerobolus stellatus (strain SS14) TaxID=990650 RepID=A0A0C9UHC6_SPHS4|nr:hypothetical protein M422DRAFT_254499 [Sphaerobolus stellatus SS14]